MSSNSTPNVTGALAAYAAGLELGKVPAPVVHRAKVLTRDTIGLGIKASSSAASAPVIRNLLIEMSGLGKCAVFGHADRLAPWAATLMNGALVHSLDCDDTHNSASMHPGAVIVPAALAAAEITNASGARLLEGVIAGYDIACRLGMAAVPPLHLGAGHHPTSTAGAIGAAAAAGRVLGLDVARMEGALGLCSSLAAGTLQFLSNGSWSKRYQVGNAAANGLSAALAMSKGFHGPSDALDGRLGFLAMHSTRPRPERALEQLGECFEIMRTALKTFPCCRFSHACIEAVLELRQIMGEHLAQVAEIRLGLHRTGMDLVALPQSAKRRPANEVDGQYSIHFAAAIAAREGEFTWNAFERFIGNAEVEALMDRIVVLHDPDVEAAYPDGFGGSAEVDTSNGKLRRIVLVPEGDPDKFPDDTALEDRFAALAGDVLDETTVHRLSAAILSLEQVQTVSEITQMITLSTVDTPIIGNSGKGACHGANCRRSV